jgi:catechol 2,3-dioxygenase-like lactoylglutathione lyase family enzyme
MKLEHIALTISDTEEINNFYRDILGLEHDRTFKLDKSLSYKIFDISANPSIYIMQKNNLALEIFVASQTNKQGYNHICLTITNREEVLQKAIAKNYKYIRIKRESHDIIFIKDKCGNTFEMKESHKPPPT